MLNPSTPEVTRVDREIAASVLPPIVRDSVLAGEHDVSGECAATVQAFARHRLSHFPARGGDELREALVKIATPLEGIPVGDPWAFYRDLQKIAAAALASTDMAGAGGMERAAIKEYLIACADAADAQKLRCGSDTAMRANLTAEAKAYRNAARMIFEQDHASYRTAAPPVEGLTSGEGEPVAWCSPGQLANLTDVDRDGGVYLPIRKTKRGNFTMPLYAASPKATATASVREPWPGYTADMERRRVVALAKVGQMLSVMAGGEAPEVEGYDAGDLYADVLMSLGVEDAEFPDLALQGVEDDPEAYFLTGSGTADTHAGSVSDVAVKMARDAARIARFEGIANGDEGTGNKIANVLDAFARDLAALHPVDSRAQGGTTNAQATGGKDRRD